MIWNGVGLSIGTNKEGIMRIALHTKSEKAEWEEMRAAKEHCRKIKGHFNKTKDSMTTKRRAADGCPNVFLETSLKIC